MKTSSCLSPNYVSRCARGQGLNIKVPGCGTPQLEPSMRCVHSAMEGGNEQRLVFVLSTAPSKQPHFAAVSYDTTGFVFATLATLASGKMSVMLNIVGEKQVGKLFSVLAAE